MSQLLSAEEMMMLVEEVSTRNELLSEQIDRLTARTEDLDGQLSTMWKKLVIQGEIATWYEHRSLNTAAQWSYAKAKELEGKKPVLWINVLNQASISEFEFQRMKHNFSNHGLSYDAIILTFGADVDLTEMSDEELAAHNLQRIKTDNDL